MVATGLENTEQLVNDRMNEYRLPAATHVLFTETWKILRNTFGTGAQGEPNAIFGGGTLLAARWKHRESTDVDFKLPETVDLMEFRQGSSKGNTLDRDVAQALGFVRKQWGLNQLVYESPDEHDGIRGKIDLFVSAPHLDHEVALGRVDGHTTKTASNAEILYGKTQGRGDVAPVRDLYDVAVAVRHDREGLTRAIEATHRERLGRTVQRWWLMREHYRKESTDELKGIPDRYRHLALDPATHGLAALARVDTYQLDLQFTQGRIRTCATRCDGQTQYGAWRSQASAICEDLRDWSLRTQRIENWIDRIEEHRRRSEHGPVPVLNLRNAPLRFGIHPQMKAALETLPESPLFEVTSTGEVILYGIGLSQDGSGIVRTVKERARAPTIEEGAEIARRMGVPDTGGDTGLEASMRRQRERAKIRGR